jgi:hypothetical protein
MARYFASGSRSDASFEGCLQILSTLTGDSIIVTRGENEPAQSARTDQTATHALPSGEEVAREYGPAYFWEECL